VKHSPLKKPVGKALSPTNAKQTGQETSDHYKAVLPPSQAVRRIMRKHGLPEPSARSYALLVYGETALNG